MQACVSAVIRLTSGTRSIFLPLHLGMLQKKDQQKDIQWSVGVGEYKKKQNHPLKISLFYKQSLCILSYFIILFETEASENLQVSVKNLHFWPHQYYCVDYFVSQSEVKGGGKIFQILIIIILVWCYIPINKPMALYIIKNTEIVQRNNLYKSMRNFFLHQYNGQIHCTMYTFPTTKQPTLKNTSG